MACSCQAIATSLLAFRRYLMDREACSGFICQGLSAEAGSDHAWLQAAKADCAPCAIFTCISRYTAMRRMAQLIASRVSALSAAAMRPSAVALGCSAAPAPVLAQRASLRTLAPFLGAPVRPHAPGLSQIRAMTEEASPVLADVLREEVKYEQDNYKQPEARSLAPVK